MSHAIALLSMLLPLTAVIDQPERPQEWGTLEGRVTWKGAVIAPKPIIPVAQGPLAKGLLAQAAKKGLLVDPALQIDPMSLGVANVAVYLRWPKGKFVPIHADDKTRNDTIVIDAPLLIYEPHMVAYYPAWFDGKGRGATGQKLVFKNSTPIYLNVSAQGDQINNKGFNRILEPMTDYQAEFVHQRLPIEIRDHIHPWQSARVFVFDHPYFSITKADGSFRIPRVPAGMEVHVMSWHEAQGWLLTKDGKTMTLKAGKNVLDLEMSAK